MNDTTRRTALKYALGTAAAGATMTSLLDRAYGQEGRTRLALTNGGYLLLNRAEGNWRAQVIGPDREEISAPTGLIQTDEAGIFALDEGRVLDGTVRDGGFSQHSQHSQHTEVSVTGGQNETLLPAWRRQPVLRSQQRILQESGDLSETQMQRIDPDALRDVEMPRRRIDPRTIDPRGG